MFNKDMPLRLLVYSYIALPFIIFAAGFLKWYFALPMVLAVVLSVVFAAASSEGVRTMEIDNISRLKLVIGLILIVTVVILSGIGNVAWQNNDHATRNTLFDILVNDPWPVKYTQSNGTDAGIVYYIGFWLPAALFGKIFSLEAGYVFQIVWAVLGLFILYWLLCLVHKKVVIYPLVIFLMFSGLDCIGQWILAESGPLNTMQTGMWAYTQGSQFTSHLEWWANYFQYSSHITQLFWVFNQCLPVWLATLLLLVEKNNKNLVFIMGVTLLSSTLPFIGLIPVFIWCAVTQKGEDALIRPVTQNPKDDFISLFTYQNVIGGGVSGIMSFLYLRGNTATAATGVVAGSTQKASAPVFSLPAFLTVLLIWAIVFIITHKIDTIKAKSFLFFIPAIPLAFLAARINKYNPRLYIMFIIFEVLILAALLLPAYRKSSLFFIAVSCLLIIPFFRVGKSIDFCMRVSIPLLAVMSLFASGAVDKYFKEKKLYLFIPLVIVLLIGSVTPMHEVARTVEASLDHIEKYGEIKNDSLLERKVKNGNNFSGKTENNIFFEFFAQ